MRRKNIIGVDYGPDYLNLEKGDLLYACRGPVGVDSEGWAFARTASGHTGPCARGVMEARRVRNRTHHLLQPAPSGRAADRFSCILRVASTRQHPERLCCDGGAPRHGARKDGTRHVTPLSSFIVSVCFNHLLNILTCGPAPCDRNETPCKT